MPEKPDLAALIGSRICHDLISPIGAIGNGVELMLMEAATKGPELALISESVANASARIRYFRVAFGAAGGDTRIGRPEVLSILSEITKGSRMQIGWTGPADLARREVKIAFLLIQCLETAMPWGGQITVLVDGQRWTVTGTAPRLRVDAALWDVLSAPGPLPDITPALVHFALVSPELRAQNRRLTVEIDATEIRLEF